MKNILSQHFMILLALCLLVGSGCTSGKSKNEIDIGKLTCKPKAQLEQNLGYAKELAEHYCTAALSELAPKKPDGVEDLVKIENKYPALPNYAAYPDIDVLQYTSRRLALISKCVHKKCLSAANNKKLVCRGADGTDCADPKATYLADALIGAAEGCKMPHYFTRRMLSSLQSLYETREKKELAVCESAGKSEAPHLAMFFGEHHDQCSLTESGCDEGMHCAYFTGGNRCLESPQEEDLDKVTQVGQACTTSRVCVPGTACFSQLGNPPVCTRICTDDNSCDTGEICYKQSEGPSFCQLSCAPDAPGDGSCVVDGKSFLKVHTSPETLEKIAPKKAGASSVTTTDLKAALAKLKSPTCGNGTIEYPESCDSGANNGTKVYGGWCTKECKIQECGDSVLDAGEQCECDVSWHARFLMNERLQMAYRSPMNCPARFSMTDGTETAMAFGCHQCRLIHQKNGRDDRTNKHFLPEKDFGAEMAKPGGGVTQAPPPEEVPPPPADGVPAGLAEPAPESEKK
ncbi:MAG: hypothetical protein HOK97_03355 [Deltaproteobacteria bacterium]|nr:hypothetical protein [Deltaproteobacteria bacterium]